MAEIIKLKTGSPFEERGAYSRAVAVDDTIYVSLTAGRNPETRLISPDLAEQTRQVLANVEAALQALGSSLDDVVRSRVFVQDPADIDAVMDVVAARFRGVDPALTITSPRLGSPEYRIELEVTAVRGAALGSARTLVPGR